MTLKKKKNSRGMNKNPRAFFFFKACRVDTIQKVFFATAPAALTSPSEIGNISGMGQLAFVPFALPSVCFHLPSPLRMNGQDELGSVDECFTLL